MRTKKINIVGLCEDLSKLVFERGTLVRTLQGYESEREGTYSNGYRNAGTVHELKTRKFTAELTKARYSDWNLYADSNHREERLQITHRKRSHCVITHNLGGTIKRFGPDEIYEGTEEIKPEQWKIDSGRMPVELVANYLKRNLKKKNSKKRTSTRG